MYPATGFTKGQVIDYYTRVAPVLLPHLRDRPLTLKRYPNGVEGGHFYEKQCPSHAPEWVRSEPVALEGAGGGAADGHGLRPRPGPARGHRRVLRGGADTARRAQTHRPRVLR